MRSATSSAVETGIIIDAAGQPPVHVHGCGNSAFSVGLGGSEATNPFAVRMLQRRARRYASPTRTNDNNNNQQPQRPQPAPADDTLNSVSKSSSSARGIYGQFFGSPFSAPDRPEKLQSAGTVGKTFLVPSPAGMSDKNDDIGKFVEFSVAKPRLEQAEISEEPNFGNVGAKVAAYFTL